CGGPRVLSVRLPSVFASFLTVLLAARWGRRLKRPGGDLLVGEVLASMTLFALLARVALVDPLLMLAVTGALTCADHFLLDRDPAGRGPRFWRLGFWGALAVAALAKGPVGIVLPLASVGGYALMTGEWKIA